MSSLMPHNKLYSKQSLEKRTSREHPCSHNDTSLFVCRWRGTCDRLFLLILAYRARLSWISVWLSGHQGLYLTPAKTELKPGEARTTVASLLSPGLSAKNMAEKNWEEGGRGNSGMVSAPSTPSITGSHQYPPHRRAGSPSLWHQNAIIRFVFLIYK